MAINTSSIVANAYTQTYGTNKIANKKSNNTNETDELTKSTKTWESESYGKTIGEPKLSKEAQKYYEQLKRKFGNYDFILVSEDQKANAQANAGKYANNFKTVVLIDEAKIEKMATDENYRAKYEGILSGATSQLEQLKNSMGSTNANVKGYGMQVNDDGTTSFFAVLKKSSAAQKERIEKKAEEKKAEKKAAEKKAEKKEKAERLEKKRAEKLEEDTVTITANSIEELMTKINDFSMEERSDSVQTAEEMMVGQNIDFRG